MQRPILALPVTLIVEIGTLHLIAGEELRWTLRLDQPQALADLLRRCDGRTSLDDLLRPVAEADRPALLHWLGRLRGERVLIDGPLMLAYVPARFRRATEGCGPLVARLNEPVNDTPPMLILCQDALDLHAARLVNRRQLLARSPWLWVTTGPAQRGYVSPIFLPDAGPCLACLLDHFQRLSPVPQLYDALTRHGEQGGDFSPVAFPEMGLAILEQLARWKVARLDDAVPPSAVHRLHVLELETMEVSLHRVLADPTCRECADARNL